MPPARLIDVDGRHVVAVALLDRRAGDQIDAERRARQRELHVVHGQRVAGEHHVHVAEADQLGEVLDAAGVHDDRAGDDGDAAARLLTSRIIAAMRATLPSTRRSDETSLLMNAKPRRSRSRNSGSDADAVVAADDRLAGAHVAQLAALGLVRP